MAVTTICQFPDKLILWIDEARNDKSRAAFIKQVLTEYAEQKTISTTNKQRMGQEDDECDQNICKNIS